MSRRKIVVSGAKGFIGKNLMMRLSEEDAFEGIGIFRETGSSAIEAAVAQAGMVVSLAGVNRTENPEDLLSGNVAAVTSIIAAMQKTESNQPIIHVSSAKAEENTPYGTSKRVAEDVLLRFAEQSGTPVYIYRLPNVFGKWCRPNYNSVVATFCHNIARDLPITIHDPNAVLSLIYIDDVISSFLRILKEPPKRHGFQNISPVYETTVGGVAALIQRFHSDRNENMIENVGTGLTRALYATYVASLPTSRFSYEIESHKDQRGAFSEFLKTQTSGQFSYFTALPGITRGGHYHHTKTEKFLIVCGKARFRFRHMETGETHEIDTSDEQPVVVETVPGWTHDVTNIGDIKLVALLWANEVFDRSAPDTIAEKV